jgi:hypothetical protein
MRRSQFVLFTSPQRPRLSIQIELCPFFDAGIYLSLPTDYMTAIRFGLLIIDVRLWWTVPPPGPHLPEEPTN